MLRRGCQPSDRPKVPTLSTLSETTDTVLAASWKSLFWLLDREGWSSA